MMSGGQSLAVYPRVCGGTLGAVSQTLASSGLSPRVRGNLQEALLSEVNQGSIPACAGEPDPAAAASKTTTVYPRVCGGTEAVIEDTCDTTGLSPRVRGNHSTSPTNSCPHGSIPACAGEPHPT